MWENYLENFISMKNVTLPVKGILVTSLVTLGTLASNEALLAASVELGLVIDGSGSVDQDDFELQRDAYVNIFTNDFATNFLTGDVDTVIASFWQFSSGLVQEVGWTTITIDEEAEDFANLIATVTQDGGGTNTGGAISGVAASILGNGIASDSQTIDISTDGVPDSQADAELAASNALSNGIVTNTLFVGTSASGAASNAAIAAAGGGLAFTANIEFSRG
ncbi:MAG: DUF1194 domain-containing protein [Crocosphaera sp.]